MLRPDPLGELLTMFERALDNLLQGRARRWQTALGRCPRSPRLASEALLRLRRGERTLSQFLDEKVARALAPLKPFFDDSDLEFLRLSTREILDHDPALSGLIARIANIVSGASKDGSFAEGHQSSRLEPPSSSRECKTSASFSKRGTSRRLRFLS